MVLTDIQKKLAEQLLITVITHESRVDYSDLASRIVPPIFHRRVGNEIGEISKLCHELGLPLLSAKVVNKATQSAGSGLFRIMKEVGRYDPNIPEREQEERERRNIYFCEEWYKLADYLGLDLNFPRPDVQKEEQPVSPKAEIPHTTNYYPDDITIDDGTFHEGAKKQIIINAYERNPTARKRCLEIHGTSCAICGFNSAAVYGPDFEGMIHVHHIIPLHKLGEEYEVNPETDLIPVCPNCHMALHSKADGVYSPEELREKIKGVG